MFNIRYGLAILLVAFAVPSLAAEKECSSGSGGKCDPAVQKGFDDTKKEIQDRHAREQEAKDLGASTDTVKSMRRNQPSPK